MPEPRILTEFRIAQCPIWSSKTVYLFQDAQVAEEDCLVAKFWQLLKMSGKYDVVITAGSRYAQLFGLYRTLFRKKRPKHIILELMLDEELKDLLWKTKVFFQRICFSSVEVIFVSARREIDVYAKRLGLPKDRIRFLPFHTNITQPRMLPSAMGYIFSAGKTGRDFATLAAAVEGLDVKVVVVSEKYHLQGISFPPNVEVHCDIPYGRYMELLHGSSMVVVPLKKLIKSTGQVVLLEAMALGKPIVATATIGTEDYIEHGVTGVLVLPGDIQQLRKAILDLHNDSGLRTSIGNRAMAQITEKHTFHVYTTGILKAAEQLCQPDLI